MIVIIFIFYIVLKYFDYLLLGNFIYLLILGVLEIKYIKRIYDLFVLNRYLNKYNLKYRYVGFNDDLYYSLYRYNRIYTKINGRKIIEEDILNLHYKCFWCIID